MHAGETEADLELIEAQPELEETAETLEAAPDLGEERVSDVVELQAIEEDASAEEVQPLEAAEAQVDAGDVAAEAVAEIEDGSEQVEVEELQAIEEDVDAEESQPLEAAEAQVDAEDVSVEDTAEAEEDVDAEESQPLEAAEAQVDAEDVSVEDTAEAEEDVDAEESQSLEAAATEVEVDELQSLDAAEAGDVETAEEEAAEAPAEAEEEAEQVEVEIPADGRAWYVIHCYSGYEAKVRHNLEQRIETMQMQDQIFQVVVPTEDEIEVRDGKRRVVERRVFPGYILVQMLLNDDSWYVVRNTPGVTGFVGMGNEPTPLRPEEVQGIMKRMEAEAPKIKVTFRQGQKVRIIDGPFNEFIGVVDEIDMERAKVRVLVSFFGRETPVELDFLQVEKT
jgi:transcriptional antiterminator NusG